MSKQWHIRVCCRVRDGLGLGVSVWRVRHLVLPHTHAALVPVWLPLAHRVPERSPALHQVWVPVRLAVPWTVLPVPGPQVPHGLGDRVATSQVQAAVGRHDRGGLMTSPTVWHHRLPSKLLFCPARTLNYVHCVTGFAHCHWYITLLTVPESLLSWCLSIYGSCALKFIILRRNPMIVNQSAEYWWLYKTFF